MLAAAVAGHQARAQGESSAPSPEVLYRQVAPSVHMVAAAGALEDIKSKRNINVGSAVAISPREAITNCHVIQGKKLIVLLQSGKARSAERVRGDDVADLCVLSVAEPVLVPVGRIRPYATLATGERIITIGSPHGLENTLNDGLIAGLRSRNAQRLVQVTAQISNGSSGGGLFDRYGNLIGITSFILNEVQTIGFAIAIDEYASVATLPPPADALAVAAAPAPPESLPAARPLPAKTEAARGYRVELAVTRNQQEALQTWGYLTGRYADLLSGLMPETQRFTEPSRGEFVRLLAGVVAERNRASALCAELTKRGHASCAVR